jgi:hypothetical protein
VADSTHTPAKSARLGKGVLTATKREPRPVQAAGVLQVVASACRLLLIRAAGSGDRAPPGLAYEINGSGEIYPQYLRIRSHSTRGVMQARSRAQLSTRGRPMGIYASAVALWFTAIALLLTGASIRAWFRSPRPVEVEGRRGDQRLIEVEVAAVQAPRIRMTP